MKFGVVCWSLWKARNERTFAGNRDNPYTVAMKSNRWLTMINSAMELEVNFLEVTRAKQQQQIAWMAGPSDGVTLNSDGSVLGVGGKASVGGLIRDCHGQCVQAYAMNLGRCTITRAGLRGALEGIRRVWILGFRKVEVQVDSTAAVALFGGTNESVNHHHAMEVLEFREWLSKEWEITIIHVFREANQTADYLANVGHSLPRRSHLIRGSDCNLAYYLRYDCMKISKPTLINY
ncbi:Putative ribonuclease H protein At1g65750 [Linum perenne]